MAEARELGTLRPSLGEFHGRSGEPDHPQDALIQQLTQLGCAEFVIWVTLESLRYPSHTSPDTHRRFKFEPTVCVGRGNEETPEGYFGKWGVQGQRRS